MSSAERDQITERIVSFIERHGDSRFSDADSDDDHRADKLRDRLGWQAGILNRAGGKPKGMHWQTFWRLQASHDAHAERIFGGMLAKLGKAPADL